VTTPQYVVVALIIAVAVVMVLRFLTFCIGDINGTPESQLQYLSRAGWIAVCVLSIPIGGIVYLVCGKRR
jgi:branched-subunit amino acid transport protein AzlD